MIEVQVGRQAVTGACFLAGSGLRVATTSKDACLKVWDFESLLSADSSVALSGSATTVGLLASADFDQAESPQTVGAGGVEGTKHALATGHVNGRVSTWSFDDVTNELALQMHARGAAE